MKKFKKERGFSLVELLVVIGVVALLAAIAMVYLVRVRGQAGDAKRLSDLNQIGRFLAFGCPVPDGGAGEYDLAVILDELRTKYPQYADNIPKNLRDPKSGTAAESGYYYLLDDNNNCVLYANLENAEEELTLPAITAPTPRGGKGVFAAPAPGLNGSNKYFQVSN